MIKKFIVWLEEKQSEDQIMRKLFGPLGLEKSAQNMKIRDIERDRIETALQSMGLEDEQVIQSLEFVKRHPEVTLRDLIKQIYDKMPDEVENDPQLPGKNAKLPPGTPQPQQQMPMNPMQGMV